jgi:predicted XRE-type DNA-binding protein
MQRKGKESTAVLAASLGLPVMLLAKSGKSQGVGDSVPGSASEDAAILQMRADLMADQRKRIKAKKLTQAKAAKLLGVSQSRVSDLVRGKWEKFSLEMLITLATRAGLHVSLKTAA